MSNPTDTNQASEDGLTYGVDRGIPGGYSTTLSIKKGSTLFTFTGDEAVAIIDVIRTEKLKLLAEVRERVIGEYLPPDVATDSGLDYSFQQLAINMGKAGQRTKLTKLEAEL